MKDQLAEIAITNFAARISPGALTEVCGLAAAVQELDAEGHFNDLSDEEPPTEPEASYWSIGRHFVRWSREQVGDTQNAN